MKNKTIVIAGASDGIGTAAAKRLDADGHRVMVIESSSAKTDAIALQKVRAIAKRRGDSMMMCKIEVKRNYVSLSVAGVLDIYTSRTCRDKLNEVLLACKQTRVLADITKLARKLSIIDDYEFTKELKYALPSGVATALLVPPVWIMDGRFIEQVAVKSGVRVRSFCEKADAFAWLMKQI